jgi:hypothetical protein
LSVKDLGHLLESPFANSFLEASSKCSITRRPFCPFCKLASTSRELSCVLDSIFAAVAAFEIVRDPLAAALRSQVDDVFSTTVLDSFVEDDGDIAIRDAAASFCQFVVRRRTAASVWMMVCRQCATALSLAYERIVRNY